MNKNEIYDTLRKLEIPMNEYRIHREIASIKLVTGREIFQDWLHMRLAFSDNELKIRYGHSVPYGSRLSTPLFFAGDLKSFTCALNQDGTIVIPQNPITNEVYREPQFGDTVRVSLGCGHILSEAIVTRMKLNQEVKIIELSQPISNDGRISFFDTAQYKKDGSCDHGETMEGIFMKFKPNEESISRKETIHEAIPYKLITGISLSVQNKKQYKI